MATRMKYNNNNIVDDESEIFVTLSLDLQVFWEEIFSLVYEISPNGGGFWSPHTFAVTRHNYYAVSDIKIHQDRLPMRDIFSTNRKGIS